MGKWSSGTKSCAVRIGAIFVGADHVRPASRERMTPMYTVWSVATAPVNRLAVTLERVPPRPPAIWLPWKSVFAWRIGTGVDHETPPFVVREIIGLPRNANEWK